MRAILSLVLLLGLPGVSSAWGFDGHRFIVDRAIGQLPPELKALFEARRTFIVERSVDPDLWRNVGWEEEPPNHFLDMDHAAFGPYPFEGLPREYDRAVQKFGRAFVHEQGLLPWRVQEFYGRLQRAFEALTRERPSTYTLDDIVLYSAVLAHYVADGHVPLHAVVNYDGQLTNQHGLHSRWESELFTRNRDRITVKARPLASVSDPRTFMFDVLLASNRLVPAVLEADRKASEGRDFYDDEYFAAFGEASFDVLEQRTNDSISAVVSMIAGAWEQAGRPKVPTELERTPRPIRRKP
jgi:hypothetical protein